MASMTVTLTVPDAKAAEILQVTTDSLGYEDGDETRKEFLDRKIKDYVRDAYINGKLREKYEENRAEYEALEATNRAEEDAVRESAEAVNIDVG